MPFVLQYSLHDDWEILGLYKTLEDAVEAERRYVEVELPRIYAEKRLRVKEMLEEDDNEDIREDSEWYLESLDRDEKSHPDNIHIWELKFGDGWG